MLKNAYGNITSEQLNSLINNGNYKYLTLDRITYFDFTEIKNSTWEKIQKISVNPNNDKVLGYFSATINQGQLKIDGTCFVKFTYTFGNCEDYTKENKIADEDFLQFVDDIMNHPIYNRIEIMAIAENPANKTYYKWLDKYTGQRFLFTNHTMLEDGKLYDVYMYYFDKSESR